MLARSRGGAGAQSRRRTHTQFDPHRHSYSEFDWRRRKRTLGATVVVEVGVTGQQVRRWWSKSARIGG